MSLSIGQIVYPQRLYLGPHSRPIRRATLGAAGATGGPLLFESDELVDIRGRRSERGRIVADLGTAFPLYCLFEDYTNINTSRAIVFNVSRAWAASTAYAVNELMYNGTLWECRVAGVSDSFGSGPSGVGEVTDGTVTWRSALGPKTPAVESDTPSYSEHTIYEVEVWDIDARAWVTDYYPAARLAPAIEFEDWLQLADGHPSLYNPTDVMPRVMVESADLSAPPAAVAELARVVEITGVK